MYVVCTCTIFQIYHVHLLLITEDAVLNLIPFLPIKIKFSKRIISMVKEEKKTVFIITSAKFSCFISYNLTLIITVGAMQYLLSAFHTNSVYVYVG